MEVLLTGASGFLGKGLVDKLAETSDEVIVLTRQELSFSERNVVVERCDITSMTDIEAIYKKHPNIDTIVHLAALVPKTADEDQPLPMLKANVEGTITLLETFGPTLQNFVYASTAEVYGLPETKGKISEDHPARPASYYGASKLAGELFCTVYGQKHNLPVSILRFTVMYGAGDTINRAIPNFIRKALAKEPLELYGGEELRDYLQIDDAVEALYLAATNPQAGVFNIGSGVGTSVKQAAEAVIQKVGNGVSLQILPRQKPAVDIVLDVTRAQKVFGFKPTHVFPEKLEDQITWQRNQ